MMNETHSFSRLARLSAIDENIVISISKVPEG